MRPFAMLFLLMAGGAVGSHAAGWAAPPDPPSAADDPVLVGAGDIGECTLKGRYQTAELLDRITGTVFTAGDNAYSNGSADDFRNCYDGAWGRHRARTRPAPGNHDYRASGGSGYFGYFGLLAGPPSRGYYSYELGEWHVVVLNSNCGEIGGCLAGSKQEAWLREDLAAHSGRCTAAYWHHPMFSSGVHGGSPKTMKAFWTDLYKAGVDVVLNGHDHDYERFAPQDPSGVRDPEHGIREFVVGTGGALLRSFPRGAAAPNSEKRDDRTYGVLKLTLHPQSYDWEFVPVKGGTFTDSGNAPCHAASEKR
jgi:hypothetical protein